MKKIAIYTLSRETFSSLFKFLLILVLLFTSLFAQA